MAEQSGIDPERIGNVVGELRERGLIAGEAGHAELTPEGREQTERVVKARRDALLDALADGGADRDPQLEALLQRLARELCGEPPSKEPVASAR
jgi:DNA-binding MarR family transcriptional regulator